MKLGAISIKQKPTFHNIAALRREEARKMKIDDACLARLPLEANCKIDPRFELWPTESKVCSAGRFMKD